jgi:hypothetical protein
MIVANAAAGYGLLLLLLLLHDQHGAIRQHQFDLEFHPTGPSLSPRSDPLEGVAMYL